MDILTEFVSYLNGCLDESVSTEAPKNIPSRYVIVRRTGGNGTRFVDNPRITVHCWAETDYEAASLCAMVAKHMLAAPDFITNLASISQDSIYQNDLDKRHRWSAAFVTVCNR